MMALSEEEEDEEAYAKKQKQKQVVGVGDETTLFLSPPPSPPSLIPLQSPSLTPCPKVTPNYAVDWNLKINYLLTFP